MSEYHYVPLIIDWLLLHLEDVQWWELDVAGFQGGGGGPLLRRGRHLRSRSHWPWGQAAATTIARSREAPCGGAGGAWEGAAPRRKVRNNDDGEMDLEAGHKLGFGGASAADTGIVASEISPTNSRTRAQQLSPRIDLRSIFPGGMGELAGWDLRRSCADRAGGRRSEKVWTVE